MPMSHDDSMLMFADVSFELTVLLSVCVSLGSVHVNLCEIVCMPARVKGRKESKERACWPRHMVISPTCT